MVRLHGRFTTSAVNLSLSGGAPLCRSLGTSEAAHTVTSSSIRVVVCNSSRIVGRIGTCRLRVQLGCFFISQGLGLHHDSTLPFFDRYGCGH